MEIDRKEFLKALTIVKPGLSNSEQLEQTTSFAFMDRHIVTYNDELSIRHPLSVDLKLQGVVDAKEVYGLISRLSSDKIDIKIDKENNKVILKSDKVKARINTERDIVLPIKEEIGNIKRWDKIPDTEEFYKHLSFASKTCGTDKSELKTTCIFIKGTGEMYASDRYKLIRCKGKELNVKDFLLPHESANEIIKINPTFIKLKNAWVHFKNDNETIISARIVKDEWAPEDKVQEALSLNKYKEIPFPKEITKIISRVGVFAKRDFEHEEMIIAKINNGKLELFAISENKSIVIEKIKMDTKNDLEMVITPALFRDILKETRTGFLSKDSKKIKFMSPDKDWEYVILLKDLSIAEEIMNATGSDDSDDLPF